VRPRPPGTPTSPTFYEQLLLAQLPKVQKDTENLTTFFALLGYEPVKASSKMLVKLTTRYANTTIWILRVLDLELKLDKCKSSLLILK